MIASFVIEVEGEDLGGSITIGEMGDDLGVYILVRVVFFVRNGKVEVVIVAGIRGIEFEVYRLIPGPHLVGKFMFDGQNRSLRVASDKKAGKNH